MRNPEQILNILASHSNELSYKYERLYRILFNEQMFYVAYQRIYAKPGNMTPGTDGKTEDNMSIGRIARLIESLQLEVYSPKPARRIYIPKKNGKKRPLGIPSFEDKLVQEVVRMILEAIYEGHFEWTSHGFRPNRSCHSALMSIQKNFAGAKWFIEGDIKGFFDNIDHNVLIEIMKERIADERFLRLIRKFLNAGYIEDWQFNHTFSGTPQGGIISPILANIYLDKFDKYMAEYAKSFDNGKRRQVNGTYQTFASKIKYQEKLLGKSENDADRKAIIEKIRELKKQKVTVDYSNPMDNNYRRLKYERYADDFLIGVIGSKADCEKIKTDITDFMRNKLKLEMSQEKTLITNAKESAKFLGYEIYVRRDNAVTRDKKGRLIRAFNGSVVLRVSNEVVRKKLKDLGILEVVTRKGKEVWKAKGRTDIMGREPQEIVAQYNTEIRGFFNYYSIANNASALGHSFGGIMKVSMVMTLARKLNCSVRDIYHKYRKGDLFIVTYKDKKGEMQKRTFYNEGFQRKLRVGDSEVDNIHYTYTAPQPKLADRLLKGKCELCGCEGDVVMHHVRKLSDLKGKTDWERKMISMYRKTLVVCDKCNSKIHRNDKL